MSITARAGAMALLTLTSCLVTVADRGPCRRCERGGDCDDGPAACERCRAEWCPDADPESEAEAR